MSEIITAYSNNQNGVKPRDFKSNHPIQTRLQNEFKSLYGSQFAFEIKRGEPVEGEEVISNENAGLQLIAFDLKEPWTTHRKYQVFDEKYSDVFGRPGVTADRIVLCHLLMGSIEGHLEMLSNQLIAKYALTKYAVLYALRRVFDADDLGKKILMTPEKFVRNKEIRSKFKNLVDELLDGLIVDFNVETMELPEEFDYRGKMREREYVSELTGELLASYQKDIKRKKVKPLQEQWVSLNA